MFKQESLNLLRQSQVSSSAKPVKVMYQYRRSFNQKHLGFWEVKFSDGHRTEVPSSKGEVAFGQKQYEMVYRDWIELQENFFGGDLPTEGFFLSDERACRYLKNLYRYLKIDIEKVCGIHCTLHGYEIIDDSNYFFQHEGRDALSGFYSPDSYKFKPD